MVGDTKGGSQCNGVKSSKVKQLMADLREYSGGCGGVYCKGVVILKVPDPGIWHT